MKVLPRAERRSPQKNRRPSARTTLSLLAGILATLAPGAARADRAFIVDNLFDSAPNAANYFGANYSDSQVWLQFENSGGHITYTDSGTSNSVVVQDLTPVALSSVLNGSFNVTAGASATRVFAALSSAGTNPYNGQPDPFSVAPPTAYAYALAEFTYLGNSFDTADTSYEDTFAFPTTLTTSLSGSKVNSSGWTAGIQAQQMVSALSLVMPSTATARIATTVSSSSPGAYRYVGTSDHFQTGVNFSATPNATVSYSGPGYNAYLGFLKTNAPQYTVTNPDNSTSNINAYYLDYSGNGGYSGYLQITGTDGNYGLLVTNVRANTGAVTGQNTNNATDRALGTALTGTIAVAADGQTLTLDAQPSDYTFSGPWTDMVISSGNQLYTNVAGDVAAGPVVTATGDLAPGQASNPLVSTFLATISSSMVTGLLGSTTFNANASTNYWFGTGGVQTNTPLFSNLWSGLPADTYYWDPYVATLVAGNNWQGYSFPFQDRFAGLPSTALSISGIDTMTWQLGVAAVPEPSALALSVFALGIVGFTVHRRRRATL